MGGPFRSSSFADHEALSLALERARHLSREKDPALRAAGLPPCDVLSQDDLAAKARAILRGRRARDRLFGGPDMFGEPAWDMMPDLFAAHAAGQKATVSSAAEAAHVAPTTALRWIDKLIRLGLFEREADPFDRRRCFLHLSERGEELVRLAITVS